MAGTRDLNAPGAGRISQSRFWATVLVLIALGIVGSWVVLSLYGAGSYLPGLVTGFLGTLVAFVLALTWERDREGRQLAREAKDLQDRRATEAQAPRAGSSRAQGERGEPADSGRGIRGLGATAAAALTVNRPAGVPFSFLNPQLLEGAWTASASRLSELVADHKLIADLATAYGRIEELRWGLRYRTENRNDWLDPMTAPLVDMLRSEVDDLFERVTRQIEQPNVQPLGLVHTSAVGATVGTTATIEKKVIRGGSGSVPD